MPREGMGEIEHFVLVALLRLGGESYGVPILEEIAARTERAVSRPAVYIALRRPAPGRVVVLASHSVASGVERDLHGGVPNHGAARRDAQTARPWTNGAGQSDRALRTTLYSCSITIGSMRMARRAGM